MAARAVVLYYAHVDAPSVRREVAAIRAQLDARYDVFVVGYCRAIDALRGISVVPTRAYSAHDLAALPYPDKVGRFQPDDYTGNADLVPMRFFQERPDYERYWIVEYDVRFGGNWSVLFGDLTASDADLLCTTVQTYADNPAWAHWHTLRTGVEEVPLACRTKGFLPFGRVSRRLLDACDARYRQNWSGHSEVAWPTIAVRAGLGVQDFGGHGSFTPPGWRGRYYCNTPHEWSLFPGTFVYRPSFTDRDLSGPESRFPGWLWHPVKAGDLEVVAARD